MPGDIEALSTRVSISRLIDDRADEINVGIMAVPERCLFAASVLSDWFPIERVSWLGLMIMLPILSILAKYPGRTKVLESISLITQGP